jgi:hypothetical protein
VSHRDVYRVPYIAYTDAHTGGPAPAPAGAPPRAATKPTSDIRTATDAPRDGGRVVMTYVRGYLVYKINRMSS